MPYIIIKKFNAEQDVCFNISCPVDTALLSAGLSEVGIPHDGVTGAVSEESAKAMGLHPMAMPLKFFAILLDAGHVRLERLSADSDAECFYNPIRVERMRMHYETIPEDEWA